MEKKCKVVMLTTEKANGGCLIQRNNLLHKQLRENDYLTQSYLKEINSKSFHVYITSDDEIKEGDYAYYPLLNEVMKFDKGEIYEKGKQLKIIATTDEDLGYEVNDKVLVGFLPLPQISRLFINQYIESYNKGNVITEVMVEYKEKISVDGKGVFDYYQALKTNPDNTINIKPIKDSWNREEVIILLNKWLSDEDNNDFDQQKWIEENL